MSLRNGTPVLRRTVPFGTTRVSPLPSPDARSLLLVTGASSANAAGADTIVLTVEHADGTRTRHPPRATSIPGGAFHCLAWSPDGSRVVAALGDTAWTFAAAGGAWHVVAAYAGGMRGCEWSPDGERLAIEASAYGVAPRLVVVRADGTTRTTLDSAHVLVARPRWSRDGRAVAATRYGPQVGNTPVMLLDVSGARRDLPLDMNVTDLDWLPDGSALIVLGIRVDASGRSTQGVYRVPVGGGAPVKLTDVAPHLGGDFAFAVRRR